MPWALSAVNADHATTADTATTLVSNAVVPGLVLTSNLFANYNGLYLGSLGDTNHGIIYDSVIDGLEFRGFQGFQWKTTNDSTVKMGLDSGGNLTLNAGRINLPAATQTMELMPGDGFWGSWYAPQYCPVGSYVCGARVRIEGSLGGGDDTAMNGIRLYCCALGQ